MKPFTRPAKQVSYNLCFATSTKYFVECKKSICVTPLCNFHLIMSCFINVLSILISQKYKECATLPKLVPDEVRGIPLFLNVASRNSSYTGISSGAICYVSQNLFIILSWHNFRHCRMMMQVISSSFKYFPP